MTPGRPQPTNKKGMTSMTENTVNDAEIVLDLSNLDDPDLVAGWEAEQAEQEARRKTQEAAEAIEREKHRAEREEAERAEREKSEALDREIKEIRERQRAEREKAEADEQAEKQRVAQILEEWRRMPDRITLGRQSYAVEQWRLLRDAAQADGSRRLEDLLEMAQEGTITDRRGQRLEGAALDRMRHRLLMTYDELPQSRVFWDRLRAARSTPDRRWLIPSLWPWGHIPMFGGNKGAGKTTVVADLVPSLIVPGRKFLNHFEVPEVPEEDFGAGVWLINAETPAEDLDEALKPGLSYRFESGEWASEYVHVEHLQEDFGGPQMFDLTNSEIYELWFNRLIECSVCDGEDDHPPFALIVDGLTAILGGSTARYGEWYAKFRQLMRALDIPNALAVVHNTMAGGHPMGGVEAAAGADGLWTYSSDDPDSPFSKRRFSISPRLGGVALPPTPIIFEGGRLTLKPKKATAAEPPHLVEVAGPVEAAVTEPETFEPTTADLVLEYIVRCNGQGQGPSVRQIRENVPGRSPEIDAAIAQLAKAGKLIEEKRAGRGGGKAYWVEVVTPIEPD
jgi:hypothetical protein